jgi:hypothetical protein
MKDSDSSERRWVGREDEERGKRGEPRKEWEGRGMAVPVGEGQGVRKREGGAEWLH